MLLRKRISLNQALTVPNFIPLPIDAAFMTNTVESIITTALMQLDIFGGFRPDNKTERYFYLTCYIIRMNLSFSCDVTVTIKIPQQLY